MSTTPYKAVTGLGGLSEIVRRAPEPAESFSVDVEATVPWAGTGDELVSARYGFEIGAASSHIDAYLSAIAPGIEGVDPYAVGRYVTVAFRARARPDAE